MATQAEVLLGRDAYFMGNSLPMLSPHASVQDSCVECHMTLNPATVGTTTTVADHMWYITDAQRVNTNPNSTTPTSFCSNCHSGLSDVNGQSIVSSTQNGLAQIAARMGRAMNSVMHTASGFPATIYAGTTAITTANVSYIVGTASGTASAPVSEGTPFPGITFYFYNSSGTLLGSGGVTSTHGATLLSTTSGGTTPVFYYGGSGIGGYDNNGTYNNILQKAHWNCQLIGKDYSNGIHNPNFVNAVLANTLAQVTSLIQTGY